MAQSFLNSLTAPSGSSFVPKPVLADTSSAMNPQNMPLMQAGVVPQVTTPTVQSTPVAPAQSPTEMYNPQNGVGNQKVSDSKYADEMNKRVSGSTPVPSSVIGSGSNLSSAGATRSTNEAILQQYLDQQKQYQQQLLQANQAGPTESAAAQRYNQLKTQAALNQEQALASGETSSFAGGEAQRVARTDAIKLAGAAADLQYMTGQREQAVKTLEALMASGDKSFANQLKIQELQSAVGGIDKQAADTFYNIAQTTGIDLPYDPTKTAVENLSAIQKERAKMQQTTALEMTPREKSMFSALTAKSREDPLVRAKDRSAGLQNTINYLVANPDQLSNGPVQYNLLYAYTQALDSYNSAVREGELQNLKGIQSFENQAKNFFSRISNGQVLEPEEVKRIANASQLLADSIKNVGGKRLKEYEREADIIGLGEQWAEYTNQGFDSQTGSQKEYTPEQYSAALKEINPETNKPYTRQEIDDYLSGTSFNQVGSDTKPATEYNLTGGFAGMDLLQPAKPLELTSDSFANMGGLMQSTTPLQMSSVEIPKSSKLSFVNNNPGNLRFAGQYGAIKGEGGFAKFKTPQEGFDALVRQIKLDVSRGHTIASFINKFAPPTENDTKLYIQQAVKALGYKADTPLSKVPLNELAKFVALKESSTKIY